MLEPDPPNSERKPSKPRTRGDQTSWDDVAEWYDRLVGDAGSEFHTQVIVPAVLRMLSLKTGERFLDIACGQGVLCRVMHERGVEATGVDAAAMLIASARKRGPEGIRYYVGDARNLSFLTEAHYSAAACVLAIQNMHPIQPVFAQAARVLRDRGQFLIVMMHPCFRGPKETSWGWDAGAQYRRVDRYLIPRKAPIVTHPGKAPDVYTWSFHKPIEAYVKAARQAGMMIDAIEEWSSHKTSTSGPRAPAENRAREEIPMFLAMRAVKFDQVAT